MEGVGDVYALRVIAAVAGGFLVVVVLWEAFETVILPRRISRRLRFTPVAYRTMWRIWSAIGRDHPGMRREDYLSVFAPLSLLLLLALWVGGVILGVGLLQWGVDAPLLGRGNTTSLATHIYLSATTFVTLGLGDIAPASSLGRALTAIEAVFGFGFLALTISYLPVLYQSFSRREVTISMLDEWAGSPPSAVELLRRAAANEGLGSVEGLLADWERWSAELLESHISYPFLAYFRSQHDRQSWLAAITAILDVSAIVLAGVDGLGTWQARRTFAISRHAVVDLAEVFGTAPEGDADPRGATDEMRRTLDVAGVRLAPHAIEHFDAFRRMYEPYVDAIGRRFEMALPPLISGEPGRLDDWESTAFDVSE